MCPVLVIAFRVERQGAVITGAGLGEAAHGHQQITPVRPARRAVAVQGQRQVGAGQGRRIVEGVVEDHGLVEVQLLARLKGQGLVDGGQGLGEALQLHQGGAQAGVGVEVTGVQHQGGVITDDCLV